MDSNSSNEFYTETQTFFEQADTSAYPASSFSSILIKLLIGFLLYSLTIWTIIGNIIVCVIVLTNRQLKQGGMSNFLIGNLALSDLLLGLTVLPFSATLSTFKTWLFGKILCDLWLSIDVLCSTASIWALLVISLDRYIATNHPIRYRKQKNSIKIAIIYCTVSWLISIIISLGPLFFVSSDEPPSQTSELVGNMSGASSSSVTSASKKSGLRQIENSTDYECVLFQTPSFVILSSLGSFYLPLLLMIGLYTGVFLKIRQQSKMKYRKKKDKKKKTDPQPGPSKTKATTTALNQTVDETNKPDIIRQSSTETVNTSNNINSAKPGPSHGSVKVVGKKQPTSVVPAGRGVVRRISQLKRPTAGQLSSSEARITKTLGIIMGVFVVCWLPFFLIYNIRSQLADPDSISGNTMEFFLWLGYFNSALNPILYAILNANFRNAFKDILACRCFMPPTHTTLNRTLSRISSVNHTTTNNHSQQTNSSYKSSTPKPAATTATSQTLLVTNDKNLRVTST